MYDLTERSINRIVALVRGKKNGSCISLWTSQQVVQISFLWLISLHCMDVTFRSGDNIFIPKKRRRNKPVIS